MKSVLWAVLAAVVVMQLTIVNTVAKPALDANSQTRVQELEQQVSQLETELALVRQGMDDLGLSKKDYID